MQTQEAKPKKNRAACLVVVGLFVVICLLAGILRQGNQNASSQTQPAQTQAGAISPAVSAVPTNTLPPSPTLEPKEQVKALITQALGSGNRNVPRIREIGFDQFEPGDILVEWSINDSLTTDLIKLGAKLDAKNILKAVVDSKFSFSSVVLQGYFSMQDVYGNSSEVMAVSLVYSKATIDKINWPNFLTENVYTIADQSSIVPAFR